MVSKIVIASFAFNILFVGVGTWWYSRNIRECEDRVAAIGIELAEQTTRNNTIASLNIELERQLCDSIANAERAEDTIRGISEGLRKDITDISGIIEAIQCVIDQLNQYQEQE